MAPQQIQWGTITLHLDNEAFRKGFLAARAWYFADMYGEEGRNPEEPQHAVELNVEEVLRLVVMLDDQGRYHARRDGLREPPRIPGLSRRLPGWTTCP